MGCSYSRSQVCVLKPSCHLTNGAFVCSINSYQALTMCLKSCEVLGQEMNTQPSGETAT